MTLTELFGMLNIGIGGWSLIIIAILSFVEVSKIKINPWSWLGRTIGRALNKELYDKVDEIEKAVKGVAEQQIKDKAEREEDKAIEARIRILRFNDELLLERRHSKESFDQTLADVTFYEDYCEDHRHFKNDKAVMAIKNVRRCYDKCSIDHDFL